MNNVEFPLNLDPDCSVQMHNSVPNRVLISYTGEFCWHNKRILLCSAPYQELYNGKVFSVYSSYVSDNIYRFMRSYYSYGKLFSIGIGV